MLSNLPTTLPLQIFQDLSFLHSLESFAAVSADTTVTHKLSQIMCVARNPQIY